jgi:hypothetical protein
MLWLSLTAAGIGVLLGLCVRVPAVLAASGALVLACIGHTALAPWSLLAAVASTFGALAALQGGYVVGLVLSCAWARATSVNGRFSFSSQNKTGVASGRLLA